MTAPKSGSVLIHVDNLSIFSCFVEASSDNEHVHSSGGHWSEDVQLLIRLHVQEACSFVMLPRGAAHRTTQLGPVMMRI